MPTEIDPQELVQILRSGTPVLLIDVREDWERGIAKLPGDVHIPLDRFTARAAEIAPPEGSLVVIYCHAGMRSWNAAGYLEQSRGLKSVVSLAGGIDAWSRLVDPSLPRY